MKFQKSVIAFAVATAMMGSTGAAFAGTASSTYNTYAVESLPSLTAVVPAANAYQTGILIANGTKFSMMVQLSGGAKWAGAYAPADITIPAPATMTVDAVAVSSADPTVLVINFTATTNIPVGTVISFAGGSASAKINMSGVSSTGSVNAAYAITNGVAPATSSFPTSGVLDNATGEVAAVAEALSGAIVPSNSFPIAKTAFIPALGADFGVSEKAMIDVGAATPFTLFTGNTNNVGATATTLVNLGAFYINEVPGDQLSEGGADYTLAANTDNVTATMTGSFPKNATFKVVSNDNTCAGAAVGTATLNAGLNSVDIKLGVAATAGNPYSICMTVDGNTAIPETTPQLTAFKVVDSTAGNTSYTLPTTALYTLAKNGASAQLINYVPAAAAPYQTYVRVANNSSLTAPVTVAVIGADGTTLGSGTLNASMAPGASTTFSAAQVEAAAGVTLAAADRVQVLLTAPVPAGKLNAQAFLADPNGGFSNMTSNK